MDTPIQLISRCKLNLGLEIVRRREDGYHDLVTLFQSISLADRVMVRLATHTSVSADDPDVPSGPDNLCYRAVEAFAARFAPGLTAEIAVEKRVPAGAGLGGGSSNAAATLLALQHLTQAAEDEALLDLASTLGADVPYFLSGGLCLARGIGDRLAPLGAGPDLWFVLVKPELRVSTAEAYASLSPADFSNGGATERLAKAILQGDLEQAGRLVQNAFLNQLAATRPVFLEIEAALLRAGALGAGLTGSGSCMFGLFADEPAARRTAELVGSGAYWVQVAHSAAPAVEVVRT